MLIMSISTRTMRKNRFVIWKYDVLESNCTSQEQMRSRIFSWNAGKYCAINLELCKDMKPCEPPNFENLNHETVPTSNLKTNASFSGHGSSTVELNHLKQTNEIDGILGYVLHYNNGYESYNRSML